MFIPPFSRTMLASGSTKWKKSAQRCNGFNAKCNRRKTNETEGEIPEDLVEPCKVFVSDLRRYVSPVVGCSCPPPLLPSFSYSFLSSYLPHSYPLFVLPSFKYSLHFFFMFLLQFSLFLWLTSCTSVPLVCCVLFVMTVFCFRSQSPCYKSYYHPMLRWRRSSSSGTNIPRRARALASSRSRPTRTWKSKLVRLGRESIVHYCPPCLFFIEATTKGEGLLIIYYGATIRMGIVSLSS